MIQSEQEKLVWGATFLALFFIVVIANSVYSCQSRQGRALQLEYVTYQGVYEVKHWKDMNTGECFSSVRNLPLQPEQCRTVNP